MSAASLLVSIADDDVPSNAYDHSTGGNDDDVIITHPPHGGVGKYSKKGKRFWWMLIIVLLLLYHGSSSCCLLLLLFVLCVLQLSSCRATGSRHFFIRIFIGRSDARFGSYYFDLQLRQ